jgi:hypothetical protein
MSYHAIVTRIKTRPHPNADKLQLGTAAGNQVVVGLDTQDGELGVYFNTDGQLSEPFVEANNLYSKSAMDKLGLAYAEDHKFGFFSERRRVRAQSFRGEKSDGFWVPLSYFEFTGHDLSTLNEGDQFTSLGPYEICNKYYTPATQRLFSGQQKTRRDNPNFHKHVDTKQLRFFIEDIKPGSLITITEKLHGTSGRLGNVLDEYKPTFRDKAWGFATRLLYGEWATYEDYTVLHGSRNVLIVEDKPGFYGTHDFRHNVVDGIVPRKGEILYYEIVGYVAGDQPIMGAQPIVDKELQKLYGSHMLYKYGQLEGTHKAYVYRSTVQDEDGHIVERSHAQTAARALELGLDAVPMFSQFVYDGDVEKLRVLVESLTDGPSTLDPSHIREGVVVRVDYGNETHFYKNKSHAFGVLEGYIKDRDDYVDTEEAA